MQRILTSAVTGSRRPTGAPKGVQRNYQRVPPRFLAAPALSPGFYLACTTHVPRTYHTCTSHLPRMYLAFTSQSLPKHMARTSHVPGLYQASGAFARLFRNPQSVIRIHPTVASGAFVPPFIILHSSFRIHLRVFSISLPNTTRLPHRPRGGLGAPWTYPGHVLYP